jgi:hypothetical protein
MVTDQYGNLLEELGKLIGIPDLHPDANNSCLLKFENEVSARIEMFKSGFLIIAADLDVPTPGKYRETLFEEALKANGLPHPRYGTLAFRKKNDHLMLFDTFSLDTISPTKIAQFLPPFVEKASIWKEAIAKGNIPTVSSSGTVKSSGMFGLAP